LLERSAGKPFSASLAVDTFIKKMRVRNDDRYAVTKTRNMRSEEALDLWTNLLDRKYVALNHIRKPDRAYPNIPKDGIRFYRINSFRLSECQETTWYKAHTRKVKWKRENKQLDVRKCRVLKFLWAIFREKPFTYNMVMNYYRSLNTALKSADNNLNEREKEIFRDLLYQSNVITSDFADVWNAMIRNGYLTPYKRRTATGTNQQNEYTIDRSYAVYCLSQKS
jgi:hypothetical protein